MGLLFFAFGEGEAGGGFDAALFDVDGDTFVGEFAHNNFGVEGFGHHDAAFFESAFGHEAADEGRGQASLDDGEGVAVAEVGFAVVVHGVDEVFGSDAVFHSTDFGADAGVAVDGGAELGRFGKAASGDADGGDLDSVDFHFTPVIEIEEGKGFGDVNHFIGEGVFENGVVHAFGDEGRINAETDPFFVSDGVGFHKADGIGKAEDFDFGFERFS